MNELKKNKKIIFTNFTIVVYFILIWLVNFYKIDFIIVGVLRELLTIPFLIAQIIFLFIGIKHTINNQIHFLTLLSVLSLGICTIVTIGSFF